jgi:hypothetical protein
LRVRESALVADPLHQAEVAHHRFAASIEEDVPGLEIAVQDAVRVGELDRACDLGHQANTFTRLLAQ